MIKLTKEEEMLEKKEDLVFLWLYKNEISFKEISEQYVEILEWREITLNLRQQKVMYMLQR